MPIIAEYRGYDIDLVWEGIKAFIFMALLSLAALLGAYSVFSRLKYLEINNTTKPTFKYAISSVINIPPGVDFIYFTLICFLFFIP